MVDLRKPSKNNEPVNENGGTNDDIAQDKYYADNIDFIVTKSTTPDRNISSSEDSGTQTQIPYEFDENMNELGAFIK